MSASYFQQSVTNFITCFIFLVNKQRILTFDSLQNIPAYYDLYAYAAEELSRALVYSPLYHSARTSLNEESKLEPEDVISAVTIRFLSYYDTIVTAYTEKFPKNPLPIQLQLERYVKTIARNYMYKFLGKQTDNTLSLDAEISSESNKKILDTIPDNTPSVQRRIESAENILRYMHALTSPNHLFSFVVIYGMENKLTTIANQIHKTGAVAVFYHNLSLFAQIAGLRQSELASFMNFSKDSFLFESDTDIICKQLSHYNEKCKLKISKVCGFL